MSVHLVDCHYTDRESYAAAYVVPHGQGVMIVETNTAWAVPGILARVEALGATPDDVTHVVITHVHLDHAGGASALMEACPRATLLAHPRAAPHAIDPSRLVASATQVYGPARFADLYGTIGPIDAARVRVLDDEERLEVGGHALRALHTRGHADHHLCLVDEAVDAVFTGDAFGIRYPCLPGVHFPSTSPADFDPDAAIASARRVAATGVSTAWLTHFGALTGLPAAAEHLAAQLARYREALHHALGEGLEGEALDAFCRDQVDSWFGMVADEVVALDRELNAQGLAVAVSRARRRGR